MNNYYRDVLVLFAFIAGFGIAVIAVVWFKVRERRWWITTLWLRCLHTVMYHPLLSWIAKRLCLFWLFDDKNLDGSYFPRWDKIPLSQVSFVEIAKFSSVCDETRTGRPSSTISMIHTARVRFNPVHARELTPKSNDVAKLRAWEVDTWRPGPKYATLPHLPFSRQSYMLVSIWRRLILSFRDPFHYPTHHVKQCSVSVCFAGSAQPERLGRVRGTPWLAGTNHIKLTCGTDGLFVNSQTLEGGEKGQGGSWPRPDPTYPIIQWPI